MREIEKKRKQVISLIQRLGYPEEFGILIAQELGTEKQMSRMVGYLLQCKNPRIEDVVDEMLAIKEDFASYQRKHIREYNNVKYNTLLALGLDNEDDK